MLQWCSRYNLIATGGSDCHDKEIRPLGIKGISHHDLDRLLKKIG